MEAEIELRSCSAEDFQAVFTLLQQLWPEGPLDRGRLHEGYRRGLAHGAVHFVGAFAGGALVGLCALSVRDSLWMHETTAHVDELVVDDAGRSRGVGTRLLHAAEAVARGLGCARLELDSGFHRDEAHQFYAGLGYERRAVLFSKLLDSSSAAREEE